jgi:hypothetical protein
LLGKLIGYMTGDADYAFILEFNLCAEVQRNIEHPLMLGAFGYAASLNYCKTQALVVGG